jgi:hypothetical protein
MGLQANGGVTGCLRVADIPALERKQGIETWVPTWRKSLVVSCEVGACRRRTYPRLDENAGTGHCQESRESS